MKRGSLLLVVLCSIALLQVTSGFGQVTLVSPEEGRRALKNFPPEPPKTKSNQAVPTAPDATAAAPDSVARRPKPIQKRGTVLPDSFAGWVGAPTQTFGPYSAATLAGDDAPILLEYGYLGAERKQFTKQGRTLSVEALRLKDSSGSYGLFTYYRGEDWQTSETGREHIAIRGPQILVRKEEILVRASFPDGPAAVGAGAGARITDADLRELLAQLETSGGGALPTLPLYFPERGLLRKSRKYILGPATFTRVAENLPAALVDFNLGAEAYLARYQLSGKTPITLLLISYPIPQVAAAKIKELKQLPPADSGGSITSLYVRRIGPLLALVRGAASKAEADRLLEGVTYTADIVWNQRVDKSNEPTLGQLLLDIVVLIAALFAFALVAGLCFGFLRVVLQRRYPNRFFDRPEETEIIRLNINYSRQGT